MVFYIIRMWAPPRESETAEEPRYVARVEREGRPIQWTLSDNFSEANVFKNERPARLVVQNVRRIVDRVERGWLYEIIRIQENIVATNVPEKEAV